MRNFKLFTLLSLFLTGSAIADVVIIGNPSSTTELTAQLANNLFMGKSRTLPNGVPAKVLELAEGDATRQQFHDKITHKNDAQLKSYWARMVFTGKGVAPAVQANATLMKATVASTQGAIGYIDEADLDNSVKVLLKP